MNTVYNSVTFNNFKCTNINEKKSFFSCDAPHQLEMLDALGTVPCAHMVNPGMQGIHPPFKLVKSCPR